MGLSKDGREEFREMYQEAGREVVKVGFAALLQKLIAKIKAWGNK